MNQQEITFLVIGAQKCATSWLYYCLYDHPELRLPNRKREVEYIGGELYRKKGIKWYLGLWNDCKSKKKGDVSIEYLYNLESPQLVEKHLGNEIKLVISLRNPIDRARSAYYWYQRKEIIPSEMSLEKSLMKGINDYKSNKKESPYYDLIARGMYYAQIENYLEYFSKNNFFIILFDDIKEQPETVIQQVYHFLNISTDFTPPSLRKKPKKNSYWSFLLSLERKVGTNKIISAAIDRLNQYLSGAGFTSNKAEVPNALQDRLTKLYRQDMIKLNQFINVLGDNKRTSNRNLLALWGFPLVKVE